MNFSPHEWDELYRTGKQLSHWPWSDLVAFVHRHAPRGDGFHRVLELGCGAGANIPLFVHLGVDYHSIEASPTIVAELHLAFPALADRIVVGDFTRDFPFSGSFDLVVDRSSLTHNTTSAIRRTLAMVFDRLRAGGKFIGIDWFSSACPDAQWGHPLDEHTRAHISQGEFAGLGAVHFSDQDHLVELLTGAGFRLERLEHKQIDYILPAGSAGLGRWNFVAVKG
jgi:SAM-dependent methyltransferase